MDSKDLLWLETEPHDSHWEAYYRRTYTERDRVRDFYDVPEMLDGNENAWDALRRRERMAEACYEV
jgi:hypothetical protein